MLFTDGNIVTIQDLREHDNFVLDVASTESIELGLKLAVGQREIGYELTSFLATYAPGAGLGNVVVSDQLRDLLSIHALSIVYRDAYNLHLNDRYLGRWKEFTRATERGFLSLLQNGVGILTAPMARAAKPEVSSIPEGGLPEGAYRVQTAWQNASGTIGEKSVSVAIDAQAGSLVVNPGPVPSHAIGWHVFIGAGDVIPSRQNDALLEPGSEWLQGAALRQDLAGVETSRPDYYVRNSGRIHRG